MVAQCAAISGWTEAQILKYPISKIIAYHKHFCEFDYKRRGWKIEKKETYQDVKSELDKLKELYKGV